MPELTIAFILGATLTTEHCSSLRSDLESKGYATACADPPSITAEDATTVTSQDDIDFVQNRVLRPLLADGKDVLVVVHSYAGSYGAAATQGLSKKEKTEKGEKGGVIGVVYIASLCVDPGESALQALGLSESNPKPGIVPGPKPASLTFNDYKVLWPSLSEEEGARWLQKLQPCAMPATLGPMPYAPYKDPNYDNLVAFIMLEGDVILTKEMNQRYLKKSGISLTRTIPGGHGINFESRAEVLAVIVEFATLFNRS